MKKHFYHFYVPNVLSDCTFSIIVLFNKARLFLITYGKNKCAISNLLTMIKIIYFDKL